MQQQKNNPEYVHRSADGMETCHRCGGHNVNIQYDNTLFCFDCHWSAGNSVKEFWCPNCQAQAMEYADHRIQCPQCGCTIDLDCAAAEESADTPGHWKIRELKAAKIHTGIRRLGFAFSEFSHLAQIALPEGLDEIGHNAFAGCFQLREVQIPDSVRLLGTYAFDSCAFCKISLPEGIMEIPEGLFADCKNLTTVTLPSTLTGIGAAAFQGCVSLEELEIPAGVRHIGSCAFRECKGLKRVILPSGDIDIGENAFPPETQLIRRE